MDRLSPERRSWLMSRIRGSNTKPEIEVRSMLHGMGYRFRLHRRDLPGTPDIVLPGRAAVVFVHGCFWHQHVGCKKATIPLQNADFWMRKLTANCQRDIRNREDLQKMGWNVLVIWECQRKRDTEPALQDLVGQIKACVGRN